MSQIARADHNEMVIIVYAKYMADLCAQFLDVVPIALLAKFAKTAKILPDLRSGDIHFLSERVGGDPHHAVAVQAVQLTEISRKTPNNRVGNVFFLHVFDTPLHWTYVKA